MNAYGLMFIILSWGIIIGLMSFCFYKIFSEKRVD